MTEDCLLSVTHVELRRHEGDIPHSFYTFAGSVLVLETYEAAWEGRDVAWRAADRYEPET